jgi:hypothetical protein
MGASCADASIICQSSSGGMGCIRSAYCCETGHSACSGRCGSTTPKIPLTVSPLNCFKLTATAFKTSCKASLAASWETLLNTNTRKSGSMQAEDFFRQPDALGQSRRQPVVVFLKGRHDDLRFFA